MKIYHFALFFLLIATGFFVMAQIETVAKLSAERTERTEYDCLVAAVNATVDVVFSGDDNTVTRDGLNQAEEVFFQTLAVLYEGSTDESARTAQKERVPLLVVFDEEGYYQYGNNEKATYGWSQKVLYDDGEVPDVFFDEAETLLTQFYYAEYGIPKEYRMEYAAEGVWERSISPPCVFAVYSSSADNILQREGRFLYAASARTIETYLITEDNYCHLPYCDCCETKKVVARYVSQKESAEDGAVPCKKCFR